MPQLLEYLPLKALAQSLKISFRKLPFMSDAGSVVPDEMVAMETQSEPITQENPNVLEARVLEILRVASKLPPGDLRRDALVEVTRLRQRAIELRRHTAADLKARIAAQP